MDNEEQKIISEEEFIDMVGQEAFDQIVYNSNHPELRRPRPPRTK